LAEKFKKIKGKTEEFEKILLRVSLKNSKEV